MNSSIADTRQLSESARGSLWRHGLRAAVGSSVLNSIVYVGAALAGVFPYIVKMDPAEPGLTVFAVVLVSVVASFAAMGAWKLVARFTESPLRPYLWLAGIILLLSFAAPYAVPGTTAAQAFVLNVLHVVVAAAVVWEVRKISR